MAMIVNRRHHGGHNHHHHQTVSMMTTKVPCMQKVWWPAVPLWEKEFCFKVGLFTWKRFMEAKKYTYLSENVMKWDDSAAEEAFLNAKKRFRAHINGFPWNLPIPSPDMFIDEIDWNSEPDLELFSGLESTTDDEGEVDYIDPYEAMLINRSRIEDIKPTGWDVDVTEFSRPVLRTGLIVGDHSSISEDSSRIS